jgi:hypothetical protein
MQAVVENKLQAAQLVLAMAAKRLNGAGGGAGLGAARAFGGGEDKNELLKELRKKYDANGDGKLTREELEAAAKEMNALK